MPNIPQFCVKGKLPLVQYIDQNDDKHNTISMSRLSFKAFCIELYADHTSIPSNEVYTLFENRGILKMLDDDYDILHGHGFDYIMHDIDSIVQSSSV